MFFALLSQTASRPVLARFQCTVKSEVRLRYSKGNPVSQRRSILKSVSVEKINQNPANYNDVKLKMFNISASIAYVYFDEIR